MNILEFSERYRLRVKRDGCGDPIILAKLGHIYEHGPEIFGMVLEAPAKSTRLDQTLRSRKRRVLTRGFTLHQEGDFESILLFDPADSKQVRAAIKLVGARKGRKVAAPTVRQLQARALFSERARSKRLSLAVGTHEVAAEG